MNCGTLADIGRRRKSRARLGRRLLVFLLLVCSQLVSAESLYGDTFGTYSRALPPEKYGNIILSRKCLSAGQESVLFTHWTHRMIFSCRVCHFELGFPMEVNAIDITMEQNRSGKFCGSCHDGKRAFGTTEADCGKCHYGKEEFDYGDSIDRLSWLPESLYGNRVDWSAALDEGVINPIFCFDKETCKVLNMKAPVEIEMGSESKEVPPVVFPHARHGRWLDCLNCHPGNVVSGGGRARFPDQGKYRRKFCQGCHMRIAFPMDNCERCHPGMDNDW